MSRGMALATGSLGTPANRFLIAESMTSPHVPAGELLPCRHVGSFCLPDKELVSACALGSHAVASRDALMAAG